MELSPFLSQSETYNTELQEENGTNLQYFEPNTAILDDWKSYRIWIRMYHFSTRLVVVLSAEVINRMGSFRMLPPDRGLVYDYLFDRETQRWVPWYDTIDKERLVIPPDAQVLSLLLKCVLFHLYCIFF